MKNYLLLLDYGFVTAFWFRDKACESFCSDPAQFAETQQRQKVGIFITVAPFKVMDAALIGFIDCMFFIFSSPFILHRKTI